MIRSPDPICEESRLTSPCPTECLIKDSIKNPMNRELKGKIRDKIESLVLNLVSELSWPCVLSNYTHGVHNGLDQQRSRTSLSLSL